MSVMFVAKNSLKTDVLLSTCELILEKSHMNVLFVVRNSAIVNIILDI